MTVASVDPDELVAAMLAVAPDPEALDRLGDLADTELPADADPAD